MAVKQADIQVVQAEATYQAAQQNLILRVAQAYFNVLSALDGWKRTKPRWKRFPASWTRRTSASRSAS